MKINTKSVIITIVIVSIVLLSGYFVYKAFPSAENEWQMICKKIESNQVLESKALINDEVYSIDVGCLTKDDFITWHPKERSTPTPYYCRIESCFLMDTKYSYITGRLSISQFTIRTDIMS